MKITKIETIPVSVSLSKFSDGMDKVVGVNAPSKYGNDLYPHDKYSLHLINNNYCLSNIIIKIHTDENFIGYGEASCDMTEPTHVVKNIIDKHMAPMLIGKNPLDWKCLIDIVNWESYRSPNRFATSGIELALFDLVGKILNVPVYTLLGGKWRNKILVSIEVPRNTPEKITEHSYEYFCQGIRGIKAKIGSDPIRDAECIISIREKLGNEISLRADANCGYTVKQAMLFCQTIEKQNVDLELLEQPVAAHDLNGLKQVKESTYIPIEADESAYSLSQVQKILSLDAVDLINTKCAKAGGINGVVQWATLAESVDKQIVIGTEWGFGLKVAAKLHLGSAIKNSNPVVEFTEYMIHDLFLKNNFQLENGYFTVPNKPGLGVVIDEEKIEKYKVDI